MKSSKSKKGLLDNKKEKPGKQAESKEIISPAKESKATENNNDIIMDMPEVKDIPGQENIRPPRMREMMDITPSSSDEEGEGLLDNLNREDDDEIDNDGDNVSRSEKRLLSKSDRPVNDETKDRQKLSLDKTDGADKLNEESDPQDFGNDLDIPGAELDNEDEELGEEDEENNSYSRPD